MATDATHATLAFDCGQSSTSWSLRDASGRSTGSVRGVDTSRPIEPQLAALVRRVIADTGREPSVFLCGSSGLDRPDADAALAELADTSITRVALAHDSTTSYLGALGDTQGVMVACGTGVVTLAAGPDDVARVDGWGWILGDHGSAFWIGRHALEAAMRGYDGRRETTALTDMFADEFGDLELAYLTLQADPEKVSRIAAYAKAVDLIAINDPVARNILDKAAAHLAEAAVAAAHRVGLGREAAPTVCALGKTFDSMRIRSQFASYLAMTWPGFGLTPPRGDGLAGAELLGDLGDSPMSARVASAAK